MYFEYLELSGPFRVTNALMFIGIKITAIFLHIGNKLPSIPKDNVTNMKESLANMRFLSEKNINDVYYKWKICGHQKSIVFSRVTAWIYKILLFELDI